MIELAGIVILGIFAQWIAWRSRVPAILPLIIIGLLVGPLYTLISPDGQKLIEPIFDPETGVGIFPREHMYNFVSLAIGIILFEGGLTLNRKEIKGVAPSILKLITIGPLVTFIGGAAGAHYLLDMPWQISFLFAALITVTGPTVIAPILRNVPLKPNVAAVLKWEGILIDPIGALVAVLVFEFIISNSSSQEMTMTALLTFIKIVLYGFSLGCFAAFGLYYLLKKRLIPHYLLNVFTLALVLAVYVFSDALEHESGLLTVVIMGMVLGNLDVPKLKEILDFKESLSVLLISILFIVLSANISMDALRLLYDWRDLILFLLVVLILRPLGVFIATANSNLAWNEKLFISWVGPRGIVAAGIASLFGLRLMNDNVPKAEYVTPLVFMIVLGTVLLNATTARAVSKLLNVRLDASRGVFILGANQVSRLIGKYLKEQGRHVVLVDNNTKNVELARASQLEAIHTNIYINDLEENFDLLDMGYMLALTSSPEVNRFGIERYKKVMGESGSYRFLSANEMKMPKEELPEVGLLSYTDDYINFSEAVRDSAEVHELELSSIEALDVTLEDISKHNRSVALFIRFEDGTIEPIPRNTNAIEVSSTPFYFVYLGSHIPALNATE